MKIYPKDLGAKRRVAVLRRRALATVGRAAGTPTGAPDPFLPPPLRKRKSRRGTLGRFWARPLKMDVPSEEELLQGIADAPFVAAAYVLSLCFAPLAFIPALIALSGGAGMAATLFFLGGFLIFFYFLFCLPRDTLRQMDRRPLSAAEAEALLAGASLQRNRLERSYLGLVLDAIEQDASVSLDTEEHVRGAIRTLGDTISRLPAATRSGSAASLKPAAALKVEAAARRAEAASETDPIVAASLSRQADDLERRAALGASADGPARRAATLRRELTGQIETLRAGIVTHDPSEMDPHAIQRLAQAVEQVAGDAGHVTDARGELDADQIARLFASSGSATAAASPPTTQRAAAPAPVVGPSPAPAPQTQQVGNGTNASGPWWRSSS
jgi:hypothetical protein